MTAFENLNGNENCAFDEKAIKLEEEKNIIFSRN